VRALDQSLYMLLNGQPTLVALGVTAGKIFKSVAPENSAMPYVIFDQAAAPKTWTLCNIAYTDYFYNVKGVVEGYAGEQAAQAIDEALQLILNDTALLTAGAGKKVDLCRATQEFSFVEREENQVFFHAGNQYKITIMPV